MDVGFARRVRNSGRLRQDAKQEAATRRRRSRRFARPGLANNRDKLAGLDGQADTVERPHFGIASAVVTLHIIQVDQGVCHDGSAYLRPDPRRPICVDRSRFSLFSSLARGRPTETWPVTTVWPGESP